jgi:hypothetical protein
MPDRLVIALLDNVEDLLDERGRIRDADLNLLVRRALIDQGSLRLLVTARAAINLDAEELRSERQVTLREGLPVPDAIALLRELDPNQQFGLATASDAELAELVEKVSNRFLWCTQGGPAVGLSSEGASLCATPWSSVFSLSFSPGLWPPPSWPRRTHGPLCRPGRRLECVPVRRSG